MRIALALLICGFAAAQRLAETPSPFLKTERESVAALLKAQDAASLAWGARLAGNYGLPEFAGELEKLATWTDGQVRGAAIDSLIRLDIDVPENTLRQMSQDGLESAIILAAKHSARNGKLLMEWLDAKLTRPQWAAVHGVLMGNPTPAFAAHMLREWTIRVDFAVTEPGAGAGVGLSGGGGMCGDAGAGAPSAFPPFVMYVLYENPLPGDVLIARGPHPVGYRKQSSGSACHSDFDQDRYLRDYLMQLAAVSEASAPVLKGLDVRRSVEWKGSPAYASHAEQMLGEIRAAVKFLKSRLKERKLLDDAEALPKLEVHVQDQRSPSAARLPEVRWALEE
jgi:hypothetical protein